MGIADNYLSLKAYFGAAADAITDYLQKGKGRNLSSIGDLLNTLAGIADVKTAAAAGEGYGADKLPLVFSGTEVKVDGAVSKINGLGKYLLAKLEVAMQSEGALEVDKIEGRAGNFVFVNAHSVGLSSRLPDFQGL